MVARPGRLLPLEFDSEPPFVFGLLTVFLIRSARFLAFRSIRTTAKPISKIAKMIKAMLSQEMTYDVASPHSSSSFPVNKMAKFVKWSVVPLMKSLNFARMTKKKYKPN